MESATRAARYANAVSLGLDRRTRDFRTLAPKLRRRDSAVVDRRYRMVAA